MERMGGEWEACGPATSQILGPSGTSFSLKRFRFYIIRSYSIDKLLAGIIDTVFILITWVGLRSNIKCSNCWYHRYIIDIIYLGGIAVQHEVQNEVVLLLRVELARPFRLYSCKKKKKTLIFWVDKITSKNFRSI